MVHSLNDLPAAVEATGPAAVAPGLPSGADAPGKGTAKACRPAVAGEPFGSHARVPASPALALVSSIFFALAYQAPSRGQGEEEPAGTHPPPPGAAGEPGEEFEVHLWPFIESVRLPSGAKRTSLFLVYHKTAFDSGQIYSFHLGPYFQGPDYKFLFPIAYRAGEHVGVIPFYFSGPEYKVIPPFLYGRWESDDGAKTTWFTPFFHRTVEKDGKIRHMHFLNYFQGRDWKVLLPLAYQAGEQSIIALIDAQQALITQQRNHVRAQRDYAIAMAELERAVGTPLPSESDNRPAAEESQEDQS